MSTIGLKIKATDTATPLLAQLRRTLTDRTLLHRAVATRARILTRDHLVKLNRHKTAQKLGAQPTQYHERKANKLDSYGDKEKAVVIIPTGDNAAGQPGLEAFARVFGPVTVRPVRAKWLTIPAVAGAYGRRAGQFPGLAFIRLAADRAMLARKDGKKLQPIYWLRKSVQLSADRTLLPSEQQYADAAEQGAEDHVNQTMQTP